MATKTPKPAKTDAAPALPSSLSFEDAPIPARTRSTEPNPFDGPVAALHADSNSEGRSNTAKSLTIDTATLPKVKRLLSTAGETAGCSVRSVADDNEDGTTRVTFWTIPRITKTRKPKDAPAESGH